MKLKERAPSRVATRGAQESICTVSKFGAFAGDSKPKPGRSARVWRVATGYRGRRREYTVNASNGITFVSFFGRAAGGQLEAELRGALTALEWLTHMRDTPCEIKFSSVAFAVFMGEEPCPDALKQLLDQVRRAYVTAADGIRIDRERRSLVLKRERLAA